MNKAISLTIRMDNPCHEDWNSMELIEGARFCTQCKKSVIDFINFTEEQILDYFLKNPTPICGRIKNLPKDFHFKHLTSNPGNNRKLTPIAATLLTLSTVSVNAEQKLNSPVKTFQAQSFKKHPGHQTLSDSVLISGIIKNDKGTPIENAEINFNELRTFSDQSGFFKFIFPPGFNKTGLLQFSYGNFITQVRNYHPAMGSSKFDIVLQEPGGRSCGTMGIMMPVFYLPDSLSKLSLTSIDKLDLKTKTFLEDLAMSMKENPFQNIMLRSYYKTNSVKANKFVVKIKNFLVTEMGISADRIRLDKAELQKQNSTELIIEFINGDE